MIDYRNLTALSLLAIADQIFELTVDRPDPERLDRWLTANVKELSRNRVQKLIDWEYVLINGQLCTNKKEAVRLGDRIHLTIPEPRPLDLTAEAIPLDILYEDEHLIILNKPAGLVVHPAPGNLSGTLVNAVLAHCGDQLLGIGGVQRPGIVHRLDKHTTGAIVVAKTDLAHSDLQAQMKAKTARREYLGVVYGAPKANSGTIDAPLGRHPIDRKKHAVVPLEKGRTAITHWQVEERLGNFSLLRFRLETGRTHQIRVHSTHMGHPIVGDLTYGAGRDVGVNLPGQALHAERLELRHPATGNLVVAIAPLPEHFLKLLTVLRNRSV
ncbi:RluA family pseudouridine synthase [Leptolyngbya sp. CCNP1308]|uniref:RluA family pseudouridine synthase n=1 Tax=Leptolyngbya sp. CCNP1308 TaxID=3110255 RepID=UPI002B1E9ACA|nr:RluA family pseudouridine synthase [Leptolyngbya sp. CCNP1308]MEA5448943.1 RluA family pseudouridine synthase [Leptolyngbya sp. CCNP1308]